MSYIGSTPASQAFAPGTDTFSGTGSQVAFTLSRNVTTVNDILVVVNNVDQQPSAYTVASNILTFSAAPSSGTNNIYVRYLSTNLQTIAPQQGSVTKQALDVGSGGVGTGAAQMPTGTTAERPATPLAGMYRLNTTTGNPEWYSSATSSWIGFNQTSTYTVEFLVIAGGAGVSAGYAGGGAGGYRSSVTGESSGGGAAAEPVLTLTVGTSYTATVGAGGSGNTNGSNSVFGSITSIGGGAGGFGGSTANATGKSGGSGGGRYGGGWGGTAGSGTSGQGYAGGTGADGISAYTSGGGGGGAGGAGGNSTTSPGNGGAGVTSAITGTSVARGGGGAPYSNSSNSYGSSSAGAVPGSSGAANTGAGGSSTTFVSGGSGIVIIRYFGTQRGTGGTVTTSGGYTIHTFTTSGTYIA